MNIDNNKIDEDQEIDLEIFWNSIIRKRKFIIYLIGVFFLVGIIIAFTSRVEYTTTAKIIPSGSSSEGMSNMGGLGGLAGLAGIDLSGLGGEEISPELYPEIVSSAQFLKDITAVPLYFEKFDTAINSYNYFNSMDRPSLLEKIGDVTIGLPKKIKKIFESNPSGQQTNYDFLRFTKSEWSVIEKFKNRIEVEVDEITGLISVTVEMPDPVASAELTSLLLNKLTQRIISIKMEKANSNLQFIQERFEEAKAEYDRKAREVAIFADRNRNVNNSTAQVEYVRLVNESEIAFEVYRSLASQLEQMKIKVKEETPVFTIIEDVRIATEKSSPRRVLIITLFLISGTLIGVLISIRNHIVKSLF